METVFWHLPPVDPSHRLDSNRNQWGPRAAAQANLWPGRADSGGLSTPAGRHPGHPR